MSARASLAGVVYAVSVFAVGFAAGFIRVLLIEPRLGPLSAVAIELPLMFVASWLIARRVAARWAIPRRAVRRMPMAAVGLVVLLALEILLGTAFGQTLGQQLEAYASLRGALSILGFAGFFLIALLA